MLAPCSRKNSRGSAGRKFTKLSCIDATVFSKLESPLKRKLLFAHRVRFDSAFQGKSEIIWLAPSQRPGRQSSCTPVEYFLCRQQIPSRQFPAHFADQRHPDTRLSDTATTPTLLQFALSGISRLTMRTSSSACWRLGCALPADLPCSPLPSDSASA